MHKDNNLPLITLNKYHRQRQTQNENIVNNTLPAIRDRDKISFACLKGFMKLRIENSRKKTHELTGKIDNLPTDRTHNEIDRENDRMKTTVMKDSFYDPRPLPNASKRFLADVQSRKELECNRMRYYQPSIMERESIVFVNGYQVRSRSLNPPVTSINNLSATRITRKTSIKLSETCTDRLIGSH